ncbi:MAG: hypothetical protein O7I93_09865 [Gemmatimonadetes bacterium]|nr:hypothetical protein [Gemmatimonadota bacterium]
MPDPIFRFAEALRSLLGVRTPEDFEHAWQSLQIGELGWQGLQQAWRRDARYKEGAVNEVDGLLLQLLDRLPALTSRSGEAAQRVRTFRSSELERLQHGAAAALVAQRFGEAGLCTVLEDGTAPLARRYFSFFSLAERHSPSQWSLFADYLEPGAHHAFVGVAAESARFYPSEGAATALVELFDTTRGDAHLRSFLSPRILESLFVLGDPVTLPFFRGLLTSGYTDPQPEYCEVISALVMVRRFTGALEPNVKYVDVENEMVGTAIDQAEQLLEARRDELHPVIVI